MPGRDVFNKSTRGSRAGDELAKVGGVERGRSLF